MGDFRRLETWREAHALEIEIHRLSANLPRRYQFELASQLRKASNSIGANIAEGCGRSGKADKGYPVDSGQGAWYSPERAGDGVYGDWAPRKPR